MGFIGGIVNISIGAIVLSSLFIVVAVKGVNMTGACVQTAGTAGYTCDYVAQTAVNGSYPYAWGASEIALWGVLTIAGIVGLVVGTLNIFGIM